MESEMPRQRLSRSQAQSYVARWRAAREAQIEELRTTPDELKLRQVAALMMSARSLGWSSSVVPETNPAREQWRLLRRAYGVGG
jgi:hypothetical protein